MIMIYHDDHDQYHDHHDTDHDDHDQYHDAHDQYHYDTQYNNHHHDDHGLQFYRSPNHLSLLLQRGCKPLVLPDERLHGREAVPEVIVVEYGLLFLQPAEGPQVLLPERVQLVPLAAEDIKSKILITENPAILRKIRLKLENIKLTNYAMLAMLYHKKLRSTLLLKS